MKFPIFNITYVMSSFIRSSTCISMTDSVVPPRGWIKSKTTNWKSLLASNIEYLFYVLRNDPTAIDVQQLKELLNAKKDQTDGLAYYLQFFKDVKDLDCLINNLMSNKRLFDIMNLTIYVEYFIENVEQEKESRTIPKKTSSGGNGRSGQRGYETSDRYVRMSEKPRRDVDWCETYLTMRGDDVIVRGDRFYGSESGRSLGSGSGRSYDTIARDGERGSRTFNPLLIVQNQTNTYGVKQQHHNVPSFRDETSSTVSSRLGSDDEDQVPQVRQKISPVKRQSKAAQYFDIIIGKQGSYEKFKTLDDDNIRLRIEIEKILDKEITQLDKDGIVCFSTVDLVLLLHKNPKNCVLHMMLNYCYEHFEDLKINAKFLSKIYNKSNYGHNIMVDEQIFELYIATKNISFTEDAVAEFENYPSQFISMLKDRLTLINSAFPNENTTLSVRHGW